MTRGVATGSLSVLADALRKMLADSTEFRAMVGASERGEALPHAYLERLPRPESGTPIHTLEELQAIRPYAIVGHEAFSLDVEGSGSWFDGGTAALMIVQDVPAEYIDDWNEAELQWQNRVGTILDELRAMVGTSHEYVSTHVSFTLAPAPLGLHRAEPEELPTEGDYQAAMFLVQWGQGNAG